MLKPSTLGRLWGSTSLRQANSFFNRVRPATCSILAQQRHLFFETGYLGVADGVGGWSSAGIDPGLYAREILEKVVQYLKDHAQSSKYTPDPVEILKLAYLRTCAIGSSTVCLVFLDEYSRSIRCANLGDSGFILYRPTENEIVARSDFQFHGFNFPYQLGTGCPDLPEHAALHEFPVAAGDILILGTDGLWDNLFDTEIVELINKHLPVAESSSRNTQGKNDKTPLIPVPQTLANELAKAAFAASFNSSRKSPFGMRAEVEHGRSWMGGKPDDISIVVGRIRDPWQTPRKELPEEVAQAMQLTEVIEALKTQTKAGRAQRAKKMSSSASMKEALDENRLQKN